MSDLYFNAGFRVSNHFVFDLSANYTNDIVIEGNTDGLTDFNLFLVELYCFRVSDFDSFKNFISEINKEVKRNADNITHTTTDFESLSEEDLVQIKKAAHALYGTKNNLIDLAANISIVTEYGLHSQIINLLTLMELTPAQMGEIISNINASNHHSKTLIANTLQMFFTVLQDDNSTKKAKDVSKLINDNF